MSELRDACDAIEAAHEAAKLAVAVTEDAWQEGVNLRSGHASTVAAEVEHLDACTVLAAISQALPVARQAMERDSLRSNRPAARALRGV